MRRRLLHFSNYFRRLISLIAVLSLGAVTSAVFSQACVFTQDGKSLIGTDFDFDYRLSDSKYMEGAQTIPYKEPREFHYSYTTALSGVRLLPDYAHVSGQDVYTEGFKELPPYGDVDFPDGQYDTYYITDKLWSRYGGRPYSIVPKDADGNAFLVYHNLKQGGKELATIYLPYFTYRGRSAKVQVRFYVGNIGIADLERESTGNKTYNGTLPASISKNIKGNSYPNLNANKFDNLNSWILDYSHNGSVLPFTTTHSSNMDRGYIRLGIGNNSGSISAATYMYYGDEYYGLSRASSPYSSNVSNPAYCYMSEASEGQWYGWYEGEIEFRSADYGGSGSPVNNYNIRVELSNVSPYDFVAIDYINIKTPHICADNDYYCAGEAVTLNAYDYPEGTNLNWQQMVIFNMSNYQKGQYTDIYNSYLGTKRDVYVYDEKNRVGTIENKVVAHGDKVVVSGYKTAANSEWSTVELSNTKAVITPTKKAYNSAYSFAFKASQTGGLESFEVIVDPNYDCTNDVGDGLEGSDLLCTQETQEFVATLLGDAEKVGTAVSFDWFLEYVDANQKTTDYSQSAIVSSGEKPKNQFAKVTFDNSMPEGIYRIGYTQTKDKYEPSANDGKGGFVPNKIPGRIFKYIRVFKSPTLSYDIKGGLSKNGDVMEICASDLSSSVLVDIKDAQHKMGNHADYVSVKGEKDPSFVASYPLSYIYEPYVQKKNKGGDWEDLTGVVADPTSQNVSAGGSASTSLSYPISALCGAEQYRIGTRVKISNIDSNDIKFQSDKHCQSDVHIDAVIKEPEMELVCDAIPEEKRTIIAGAKDCDYDLVLTEDLIPSISSSVCDSDPTVEVSYSFKSPYAPFDMVNFKEIEKYKNFRNGKFKVPLILGENKVHFKFTDGCDHSAECDVTYIFKDDIPPVVDCSKNSKLSIKLSDYKALQSGNTLTYTVDDKVYNKTVPFQMRNPKDICHVNLDGHEFLSEAQRQLNDELQCMDILITPKYKGRWKTDIDLLSLNINDYITKFDTASPVDKYALYEIGHTYILWEYADQSDNKSYCVSLVEIIDDLTKVYCVEDDAVIGTEIGKCELSLDALLDSIQAELPTVTEECRSGNELQIRWEYWIKELPKGEFKRYKSGDVLKKGEYMLQIRAYKAEGLYVDSGICERKITVADNEPPTFDCDYLLTIYVDVNKNTNPNEWPKKKKYVFASTKDGLTPKDPGQPEEKYAIPTLEDIFVKNADYDPSVILSKVVDNCPGEVLLKMVLKITDSKDPSKYQKDKVYDFTNDGNELLAALRKTKFYQGVNIIEYTFKDEAGNEKVCEQQVVVSSIPDFSPDCPDDVVLEADNNCEYKITVDQWMKMIPSGKQKNERGDTLSYIPQETHTYDMACFRQNQTVEGKPISTIFPDFVEILDSLGTQVAKYKNSNSSESKSAASFPVVIEHWCTPVKTEIIKESRKYANKSFSRNDFDSKTVLKKGVYTINWYYYTTPDPKKPGPEGEKEELGICTATITVADSTPPTIDCDFLKPISKPALDYPECKLPFAQSGVKMPKLLEFQPDDNNCTESLRDFTLTWMRSDGVKEFESDFALGTTVITYIVTDKDGNSSTCTQPVEVKDESVYFPCDSLKSPIIVPASATCDFKYVDLVNAGLPTGLETNDCSDKMPIIAVPSRVYYPTEADWKANTKGEVIADIKELYKKGVTVISWTFTDKLGNEIVCPQVIFVNDSLKPVFDCSEIETPLEYKTKSEDECQPSKEDVLVELGSYTAKDNCDGEIPGVAYLMTGSSDKDREALPEKFDKFNQTYIIGWVFADNSGNEQVCRQELIIRDDFAPNPSDCNKVYEANTGNGDCIVKWSEVHDLKTPPVYKDPCDGNIDASQVVLSIYQGGKYDTLYFAVDDEKLNDVEFLATPGSKTSSTKHIITWIFEDKKGNKGSCSDSLYVHDDVKPIVDCDPNNIFKDGKYVFTVSDDDPNCELSAADFDTLFVAPIAYDECEDLANGTNKAPLKPSKITRTFYLTEADYKANKGGTPVVNAAGEADLTANYPKGVTVLHYEFVDASGNSGESCDLPIIVEDHTPPYFDCAKINPDTLKPVAKKGRCDVQFGELNLPEYKAVDYCSQNPLDSIPGELYFTQSFSTKVPSDYQFEVGKVYDMYWLFIDEDDNYKACPQKLFALSQAAPQVDCADWKSYSATAEPGKCYAIFDSLHIEPIPYALDSCAKDANGDPVKIEGVPTRDDGLELTDNYPTGFTKITWEFKSPYSTAAPVYCTSDVTVYGVDPFEDLDCERLFPPVKKVIADCGPAEVELKSNFAEDPCVKSYEAWAVPSIKNKATGSYVGATVVSKEEHTYKHSFALGIDTVMWKFSDITDTIHAYCYQQVWLLTEKQMTGDCPNELGDITLTIPDGLCEASPSEAQLDSLKEGMWNKKNPCLVTENGDSIIIKGVPSRSDGKALSDPYRTTTTITWTFKDTTKTLVDSITYCYTKVIIDGVPELVNCDRDFPSTDTVLNGTCDYVYANIDKIPFPTDPCSGQPAVVGLEVYANVSLVQSIHNEGVDGAENKIKAFLKDYSFKPGQYRLHWEYNFFSNDGSKFDILCDQHLGIKSDKEPIFDCSSLPNPMPVVLPEGKCEGDKDYVLKNIPEPVALEACTQTPIKGVPRLDDGSEKGSELPKIFEAGNDYKIIWIFENDSLTTKFKECHNILRIISQSAPQINCDTLPDTTFIRVSGECEVVIDETMLKRPIAKDSCSGADVPGIGTIDGKDVYVVTNKFSVGLHKIIWIFASPYSTDTSYCEKYVDILTDKELETPCKTKPMEDITVAVENGKCNAPSPFVNLEYPTAENPCTHELIKGVPTRMDDPNKSVSDSFRVGVTKIKWTFTDKSLTLIDSIGICEQNVVVGDINVPAVNCDDAKYQNKRFDLEMSQGCEVPFDKVGLNPDDVYDLCSGDLVIPDTVRTSGKDITEPYTLGFDTVIWIYNYKGMSLGQCSQEIAVASNEIRHFKCEEQTVPTVSVTLSLPGSVDATYQEVLDNGFKLPELRNVCGVIKVDTVRSDGKWITENYPIGETKVTITVMDTSATGDTIVCYTIVTVVDEVEQKLDCPPLTDNTFECKNAMPSPYLTLNEFLDAGGQISDKDRVNKSSFNYVDTESGSIPCDYLIRRKYSIKDLKGRESSCEQEFVIKDTLPPLWFDGFENVTYESYDCGNVPALLEGVRAYDDCLTNTIYGMVDVQTNETTPVANRSGHVYYEDWTNRINNRDSCQYYTYDITRTFIAYDNCKNASAPVTITYAIIDTVSPKITVDPKWPNDTIYANAIKGCFFTVPDITRYLPKDAVSDSCDMTNVMFFDTIQVPAPGDTMRNSMYVKLYIVDPCNNKDSVEKWVEVPNREDVIHVTLNDTTICSEPVVQLSSLSDVGGMYYQMINGRKRPIYPTFNNDYYKGLGPDAEILDRENLIYSDNPFTNLNYMGNKFKPGFDVTNNEDYFAYLSYQDVALALDRMSKSDQYTIMVMDTATGCSDTATAYITIHERPRVKLDPTTFLVCQDDSIRLTEEGSLYDKFNVCVHDMGEDITKEGWMLNNTVYEPNTIIPYVTTDLYLNYYATNACGTSTSYDSYYMPCDGEFEGKTSKEIIDMLGGVANYQDYLKDVLYAHTQITIDVKRRLKSEEFLLTTDPQDKARVFLNEGAELNLITNANPTEYQWYKVNGVFDGRFAESFDKNGKLKPEYEEYADEPDSLMAIKLVDEPGSKNHKLESLSDTSSYYVLALDGVCPAVQTNVVSINVIKKLPTAITPQNSIGLNDVFMEGYPVIIFNRYGQKMVESDNGWDGTCRGVLVDPGVYFYEITLKNGETHKGSIEVVYFK